MAQTMVLEGAEYQTARNSVHYAQMPLTFLKPGDTARIAKVRGKGDTHHHLENLGFVEGAEVTVVCEQAGNLIVAIKGAQVALDKKVASKIITG